MSFCFSFQKLLLDSDLDEKHKQNETDENVSALYLIQSILANVHSLALRADNS